MIPLRDENPTRTTPYVTFAIIAVNIIVFIYQLRAIATDNVAAMLAYALVPYEITKSADLIFPGGPQPVFLTFFTSMFMHANFLHIAMNMLYLWIFGNNIEDVLGHLRFIVFYVICGIAAALGQILLDPYSKIPMIGASGAIAGVLGAYLLLFPAARIISLIIWGFFITTAEVPAVYILFIWFITQLFSLSMMATIGGASKGGVAYAAHIGGFVAGFLLILIFGGKRLKRRRDSLIPIRRYYRPWE